MSPDEFALRVANQTITKQRAEIERLRQELRAVLGHVTDLWAQLEKANTPLWDKP